MNDLDVHKDTCSIVQWNVDRHLEHLLNLTVLQSFSSIPSMILKFLQLCTWEFHSPMPVVDWIATFQSNVVSLHLRVQGRRRRKVTVLYPRRTESYINSLVTFVNHTFVHMTFVIGMISGIGSQNIDVESVNIFCRTVVSTHLVFSHV